MPCRDYEPMDDFRARKRTELMEDQILRRGAIFVQVKKWMIQGKADVLAYLGGIKE